MGSLSNRVNRSSLRVVLSVSLALAFAAGCAGGDPLTGTWRQPDATTQLPDVIGGGPLFVDATLVFDGNVEPATLDVHLELEHPEGLTDTVDFHGTYVEDGESLTLTIEGFDGAEASGDMVFVAEDGAHCINLSGFGGAPVCFPATQTHGYAIEGDILSMTIDQAIAGAEVSQTSLMLTQVQ